MTFLQGFIPIDIVTYLNRFLPLAKVNLCLSMVLSIAQDSFHRHVWKPRCIEFAKFEASKGITQAAKHSASTHDSGHSSSRPSAPLGAATRWISWITSSLTSGSNWLGFRMNINSL